MVLPASVAAEPRGSLCGRHGDLALGVDLLHLLDQRSRASAPPARCGSAPRRPSGSTSRHSPVPDAGTCRRCARRRRSPWPPPARWRPTSSQRSAISLMKLIFMARKALAAYLASSATLAADEHDRRVAQGERLVEPLHAAPAPARSSQPTSTRSGWVKSWIAEPSRRNSGIRANGEIRVRPERLQAPLDLAAGADGHRRFRRDDGEAGKMRRDLLHRLKHVGEIGVAVAPAHRRADREKHEIGLAHGRRRARS